MKNFLYAARSLVYDSLGIIVFAVLVALGTDVVVAAITGVAIAAAIVLLDLVRHRPVPVLQWISLVLMLVSTAATYLTSDPTIDSQMVLMEQSGADVFFAEATPKFEKPQRLPVVGLSAATESTDDTGHIAG